MNSGSPAFSSIDRPGIASSPLRPLTNLAHTDDQRVLADWVQQQNRYEIVPNTHAALSEVDFDVCIIGERALQKYATKLQSEKMATDAFLPVLLMSSNTAGASSEVADNGLSIPRAQREAVFGRTEQRLGHPAAGLGLYLVDTTVTQYSGTVQITGTDIGGASIKLKLQKEAVTGVNSTDNGS